MSRNDDRILINTEKMLSPKTTLLSMRIARSEDLSSFESCILAVSCLICSERRYSTYYLYKVYNNIKYICLLNIC